MLEGHPAMLGVVIAFLGLSLLLYCLFAGADFGAGVLELFLDREKRHAQRAVVEKALGPVWEANHIWLILVVVILFTGFPAVYGKVSIHLHIPLTAMLVGIIARGCSFTFKHYDAVKGRSQRAYTFFFVYSSLWTPFCLGVVTGALVPGGIDPGAGTYWEGYVAPWLRPFPIALGIFTVCLFTFLAAVYLVGESPDEESRAAFTRRAVWTSLAAMAAGAGVFAAAAWEGLGLVERFLDSGIALACIAAATLLMAALHGALAKGRSWAARFLAGAQVALVLIGWYRVQFPVLVGMAGGGQLTFFNSHAPAATLNQLGGALLAGSVLILPALFYLLRVFKTEGRAQSPI
jgi:cytochrome bd ubiquinol oxidase subunit II